ncbi:MAG: hypothetical protein HY000_40255 [Planctomycetes bacterium]|nr:hypothetical protein [Planctomycetota bacterium]
MSRPESERQALFNRVNAQLERSHAHNKDMPTKAVAETVRTAVEEVRRRSAT